MRRAASCALGSIAEIKMHYSVITEQQVAARWTVRLKTMRRWRHDKVGPT